jgi:hypothetical protein
MGHNMAAIEIVVLREAWDVDLRLAELKLTRKGLLVARDVAMQERANATPFHCSVLAPVVPKRHQPKI